MPARKHRRRRVKRPHFVTPTPEEVIGELVHQLVDARCVELYGKREWTLQERDAAIKQLIEDLVRGQR